MPPKFMLPALAISGQGSEQMKLGSFLESLRMSENGITVMTSSFNPYSFSTEGMSTGGAQNPGQHYRISEKDVRIIERIGSGASSIVYKAVMLQDQRFVAVKKLNLFDRDTRRQMVNDIKALCESQNSPTLISFYGAYHVPEGGQISIVLEYMDAGSMADLIMKVSRVPENLLSKMTLLILQGLAFLHTSKRMVHRDIKPENILLNLQGDVKITDFGISTFIASTLSKCNTFLGTVPYMSPERLENQQYSFPADIWSLGICLVEAATGEYPYDANVGAFELTLQVMKEEVPLLKATEFTPEFQDFVRLCLQKDASKRPTAEQLLAHPFIRMYESDPFSLKEFFKSAQHMNGDFS